MSDVEVIRHAALAGTRHGFLGRRGGVSLGIAAGLNTGFGAGDDPQAVAENRLLAVRAVAPGTHLLGLYQIHSAECVTLLVPPPNGARPEGDALVTNRPGLALGIVSADCAPVLFADLEAGVVGAAHAGWKGALAGVTDTTLLAMETLGAERARIGAVVGPCIAQASYEVDAALRANFEVADDHFFAPGRDGRFQFDLAGYVAARLRAAGVGEVAVTGEDTYALPDRFYSYRRATHRGEPTYGRQLSIIALD